MPSELSALFTLLTSERTTAGGRDLARRTACLRLRSWTPSCGTGALLAVVRGVVSPSAAEGWADGDPVVVVLRPEQVELVPAGTPGSTAGKVVECEYYGHDTVVVVAPEGGTPGVP